MRRSVDPTDLIVMRPEALKASRLLVIDPPSTYSVSRLRAETDADQIVVLSRDFRIHQALSGMVSKRLATEFGVVLDEENLPFDAVVIYMPKGKELLQLTLDWLGAQLGEGVRVYVTGDKHSGLNSCRKMMPDSFGPVRKMDSARHCMMFRAVCQTEPAAFDIDATISWTTTRQHDIELSIAQVPGVFSHGHIDDGTMALVENMNVVDPVRVLDLGCGCGVIGATIAAQYQGCQVDMVDVSALAVMATKLTIKANGLAHADCQASDMYAGVAGRYDLILSNPPFHSGHDTDRTITRDLIAGAAQHLTDQGSLQIVGNRFLPYDESLAEHFGYVRTLAKGRHFAVYEARRPKT
jgi:16S rRNA (guanine1207-N2)-methyltransferase